MTYYTREDFACKCGCGTNLIQDDFIEKVEKLRAFIGIDLPVNSGYRCPAHNQAVSSTGPNGPHTTGRAVDLGVDRKLAYKTLKIAIDGAAGDFTGYGFKQHGASRFLHLDDLQEPQHAPRPTLWTYP